LLVAFGKNGERVVEALDREAMISDQRYLELELPNIDTNHNGLLDLAELGFFDANTNHVFEAAEQAGVQITLTNLAEKLMAKLDRDHNGRLDANEIPAHLFVPAAGPWASASLF